MKKYIWIAVLFWGWTLSSYADSPVGFGLKGGICISEQNYSANDFEPWNNFVGPTAGVFSDFHLLDFLSLQLEVNYAQKGSSGPIGSLSYSNFPGVTGIANYSATFDYLEIPLLVRFQIQLNKDWTGYFLAGPAVSFLLNETDSIALLNSPAFATTPLSRNDTVNYPSTDWQFYLGMGVEYRGFILEVRSGIGLTPETTYQDGISMENSSSSIQLGYRLF